MLGLHRSPQRSPLLLVWGILWYGLPGAAAWVSLFLSQRAGTLSEGLASIPHVPSACCLRSEGEPVRGKGTGTGMRQRPGVSRQVPEDQAPSCRGAPREGCPGGRQLLRVGRWG